MRMAEHLKKLDGQAGMSERECNIIFVLLTYRSTIKEDAHGFYYENADNPPARFYFETLEDAADDLAIEIGVTDKERDEIEMAAKQKFRDDGVHTGTD